MAGGGQSCSSVEHKCRIGWCQVLNPHSVDLIEIPAVPGGDMPQRWNKITGAALKR